MSAQPQMTLVIAQKHVLGVLAAVADTGSTAAPSAAPAPSGASGSGTSGTAAAASAAADAVAALVGDALPVWGGVDPKNRDLLVKVPKAQLTSQALDLDQDLVRAPLSYVQDGSAFQFKPPLAIATVTLSSSSLTVTLAANAAARLDLWVLIATTDGAVPSAPATGSINAGQKTAVLSVPPPAGVGPFTVLVLASGFAAWLGSTT